MCLLAESCWKCSCAVCPPITVQAKKPKPVCSRTIIRTYRIPMRAHAHHKAGEHKVEKKNGRLDPWPWLAALFKSCMRMPDHSPSCHSYVGDTQSRCWIHSQVHSTTESWRKRSIQNAQLLAAPEIYTALTQAKHAQWVHVCKKHIMPCCARVCSLNCTGDIGSRQSGASRLP